MNRYMPILGVVMAVAVATPAIARDARKGDLVISGARSRETSPTAKIGVGYLTIRNAGRKADRLVSAASAVAPDVQIHTVGLEGGVMRMRELPNGVEIPAGGIATLGEGGNHIMLIGLKRPLRRGEALPVTLRFARAGTVVVRFQVQAVGAPAPDGGHGGRSR